MSEEKKISEEDIKNYLSTKDIHGIKTARKWLEAFWTYHKDEIRSSSEEERKKIAQLFGTYGMERLHDAIDPMAKEIMSGIIWAFDAVPKKPPFTDDANENTIILEGLIKRAREIGIPEQRLERCRTMALKKMMDSFNEPKDYPYILGILMKRIKVSDIKPEELEKFKQAAIKKMRETFDEPGKTPRSLEALIQKAREIDISEEELEEFRMLVVEKWEIHLDDFFVDPSRDPRALETRLNEALFYMPLAPKEVKYGLPRNVEMEQRHRLSKDKFDLFKARIFAHWEPFLKIKFGGENKNPHALNDFYQRAKAAGIDDEALLPFRTQLIGAWETHLEEEFKKPEDLDYWEYLVQEAQKSVMPEDKLERFKAIIAERKRVLAETIQAQKDRDETLRELIKINGLSPKTLEAIDAWILNERAPTQRETSAEISDTVILKMSMRLAEIYLQANQPGLAYEAYYDASLIAFKVEAKEIFEEITTKMAELEPTVKENFPDSWESVQRLKRYSEY